MAAREKHPALSRNLVLIGGRGSGKSSVAKRVARANRNFMLFSLDALIRYEAGARTIPEIVAEEGWAGFRARELAVVEKVAAFPGGALIDAGGGVVVELDAAGKEVYSKRKVSALRRHGLVVYLRRDPAYLEARTRTDPSRPALSSEESPRAILERRDPWYRKAAHYVYECTDVPKSEMADHVLEWFYGELEIPMK